MCTARSSARLRAGLVGCTGLVLSAVAGPPAQPARASSPAAPVVSAHAMFDDSTGPWRSGIAPGGKAVALRARRPGVADPLPGAPARAARPALVAPPDPEVLGFAQSGEVTSGAWQADIKMSLVTTIAYFAVNLNSNGTLVTTDTGYQGWWSAQATALIDAAHSAGDRVVLTVKAFDNATISGITGSAQARQTAIDAIVAQVAQRGADGINVDFEGTDSSVAGNFTTFVAGLQAGLRTSVPQQAYLTVDTYASAAAGGTMFDIRGLSPYVDAFDVMAYDITSPGAAFAGPVAPLNGMTFADTNTVSSYLQLVSPTQVILGVPYYGYKWSTVSPQPQAQTRGSASADTYSGALADFSCAQQLALHWDQTFVSPWATWYSPTSGDPCGGNHGSWRELYYEDSDSLGAKYDLVNAQRLRGIGIWALGYDSGHQELWNEIAAKFTVTHAPTPQMPALPATEPGRAFPLSWSVPSGSPQVLSYLVFEQDDGGAWQTWTRTAATSATFFGLPSHTYGFFVQAVVAGGYDSGVPGDTPMTSTTVSSSAPSVEPFNGLYAVDAYGTLYPGSSPPLPPGTFFPGWNITRALTVEPGGLGGLVLDGWGGLHPFGDSGAARSQAYWPGWDIARAITMLPGGQAGYTLDGWGGLHPFAVGSAAMPNQPQGSSYWPGWDIARAVAAFADGSGGVVLDGFGGISTFSTTASVAAPVLTGYWPGWDIARAMVLLPGSTASSYSGYVLDGWGGLHPFASQGAAMPAAPAVSGYWVGFDIARGVALVPGSPGGYVVDGLGGFWPFGGAPSVLSPRYGMSGATARAAAAG